MSELDKQLVWPIDIQPVNDLSNSPMSGITIAKYRTGAEIRRTHYDAPLASFNAKFFTSPLLDSYDDDMAWFKFIESGLHSFLFMDPHKLKHPTAYLGIGDGVKTTWVIPFYDWSAVPIVYVDGAIDDGAIVHVDGPNMLSLAQSLVDWDSGELTSVGSTVSASRDYLSAGRQYNLPCSKAIKDSAGWELLDAEVNAVSSVTHKLNGMIEARGERNAGARIADINGLTGGTSYDEWTAQYATKDYGGGLLVGPVKCSAVFAESSGTPTTYYVGALAMTHGDLMTWYPGGIRMPVVEFVTAPVAGKLITAQTDNTNVMIRMAARSVSHDIQPDGNRFVTVKLDEVPE